MYPTPPHGIPPRPPPRPLLDRLFPVLHVAALGVAAAGVGFGVYVHQVPFRGLQTELKRRAGELKSLRNEADRARTEIRRLRGEAREAQAAVRSQTTQGDRRPELTVLRARIEEKIKDAEISVLPGRGLLRVRFREKDLFDARGPVITRDGQGRLQVLAQLVADRAAQVRVSAPMGTVAPPRWTRAQFPSVTDLSVARVRNAIRLLGRGGVKPETMLGVIGVGSGGDAEAEATLDIEIEPAA
jgi:flagellar motor protein MotB